MTVKHSVYVPPSLTHFIPRHLVLSTWAHHLPFAYDLIAALKPSLLVELGTYSGLSFFCFCQSMQEHEVDGVCYAVDTWQGDEHTGAYGEDIYESVSEHSREFYAAFSYMMRMMFNEALDHFTDESIDLLHIDGLHTYEAVSRDFEAWYPKVKPGGIILLHDIMARLKDFGVWKFWEENSHRFESFEFKHGFGLGVIRKPGTASDREQTLVDLMFSSNDTEQAKLRSLYFQLAQHILLKHRFMRHHRGGPLLPRGANAQGQLKDTFQPAQDSDVNSRSKKAEEFRNKLEGP